MGPRADIGGPASCGRGAADAGPAAILCGAGGHRRAACAAASYADTDWRQIAGLYEVLLRISPSPVIELNHAAAVSMVDGPARALDLIDALEARGGLKGYELLAAVRADLLRGLGRRDAAREAYQAAMVRDNWSRCGDFMREGSRSSVPSRQARP